MIRLDVIMTAEPDYKDLETLKAFAAVSDENQEQLLVMSLRRAFAMVQKYADVPLLAGRYCVKADDHNGEVQLYMGGIAEAVKDAKGNEVSFEQEGNMVYVRTKGYVEVEFTTTPNRAEYERLLPVVLRYATAIYDGKSTSELNAILREC